MSPAPTTYETSSSGCTHNWCALSHHTGPSEVCMMVSIQPTADQLNWPAGCTISAQHGTASCTKQAPLQALPTALYWLAAGQVALSNSVPWHPPQPPSVLVHATCMPAQHSGSRLQLLVLSWHAMPLATRQAPCCLNGSELTSPHTTPPQPTHLPHIQNSPVQSPGPAPRELPTIDASVLVATSKQCSTQRISQPHPS